MKLDCGARLRSYSLSSVKMMLSFNYAIKWTQTRRKTCRKRDWTWTQMQTFCKWILKRHGVRIWYRLILGNLRFSKYFSANVEIMPDKIFSRKVYTNEIGLMFTEKSLLSFLVKEKLIFIIEKFCMCRCKKVSERKTELVGKKKLNQFNEM